MLNIQGVDKFELLKQLWLQRQPAVFFRVNQRTPPEWDDEKAREALARGYIDYFQGRCIKTDLSKDTVDPSRYDQENGLSFADALERIK